MGTIANTDDFREGGSPAPVSRGGKRLRFFYGKITMSASYATNGDTLQLPTAPPGTALKAIDVFPSYNGTRFVFWDGSVSAPKLKAFVEGAAVFAEVANTTDLSADTRHVLAIYE